MISAQKVLHIEDNPGDADLVKEILYSAKGSEFDILHVERLSAALSELQEKNFDVILLDLGLPDSSGLQSVKKIHDSSPHIPIVVITENNDSTLGMSAVKNGAQDYLVKGLIPGFHMVRVLQYAIQRKQTDEKIRRSEQFLRFSLDGLSAHIAIINQTGDIITVNKAWTNFAKKNGIPQNISWQNYNYLGECDQAANTGDMDALKFVSGIRSVITKTTDTFEMDYPCHSPDKKRWYHGKVTPFPDDTLPYVIIVHENITERELSIQNLQRSKEKFRSIVENITIGVVLLNKKMEVLEMNHQMKKWYPDFTLNKSRHCFNMLDCFCGKLFKTQDCPAYLSLSDGKIHKRIQKIKKTTFQLLSSPLFDQYGNIAAVVLLIEDISERIAIEKNLRQAQKMESLGTLAGGIAHDFNNILTSILGFSSLIKMNHPEKSELFEDVSDIETAAHRARELVNQILTFCSRKEAEFKPIRIDLIIKEALKLLRSTIPTTIEIKIKVDRIQEHVLADPTLIHQIIMNLCTNASHAMEKKGGILEVNLSLNQSKQIPGFDSQKMQAKDFLILKVKDTGYGIPEDLIDKIFDPYFTTKNIGEGTGLGLSVVQGIVRTCGGEITVASKPDKGTEFTVLFPVAEGGKDQNADDEPTMIEGGDESILLIDDEPSVLKVEQRILRKLGYNVTIENDSEKALEKIKREPEKFDLVISDMTMPKMNGATLAEKAMRANPDLPVIICTGYSNRITKEEIRRLGVKALVYKPLSVPSIASEIRKIFNHEEEK